MTFSRKTPSLRFLVGLMLGLAAMSPIEGRTQGLQREADKAESIKQIMAKRSFEMSPVVRKNSKAFCEAFLLDFRLQKSIELIDPVAKADSYDNPVWEPYKRWCPALELFDQYGCMAADAEYIRTLPKEEGDRYRKGVCQHYRGTANFKLFLVDINNNVQDGKEHVFYYERAQGPLNRPDAKLNYGNGGYSVIDLDRCELKGGAEAHDPYSYFYQHPLENYSGIIRYQDKHYIFDLYELDVADRDPKNRSYTLLLNGYSIFGRETTHRLGPVCAYDMPIVKSKWSTGEVAMALSITPRPVTGNCSDFTYDFIRQSESLIRRIYSDGKGVPTLGVVPEYANTGRCQARQVASTPVGLACYSWPGPPI